MSILVRVQRTAVRPVVRRIEKSRQIFPFLLVIGFLTPVNAWVEQPLAAHVEVTPIHSYEGAALPKPEKIVVYDFEFDLKDVQVDKTQEIRPRHLIERDENPKHVAESAAKSLSAELIKDLAKTGLPVEHAAAGTVPGNNVLLVRGSFAALKQGVKTERVIVGMGTGSANVSTHVKVTYNTAEREVLVSEFETQTTVAKNLGAGVTTAAGVDPAVAVAKSTISDRKKTVDAYASKTADAAAKQVQQTMVQLGWVEGDQKTKTSK